MYKNKKLTIILSWLAVLLWMTLIFNLSSQIATDSNNLSKGITATIIRIIETLVPNTNFDIATFNHIVRKNAHFFAYFILGILVTNAMRRNDKRNISDIIIAILICVLYALSDEIHQFYVPGRGPQLKDVFIDSMGAITGVAIYLVFRHKILRFNQKSHQ